MRLKMFLQSGFWSNIDKTSEYGVRTRLWITDSFKNSSIVTDVSEELLEKNNDLFWKILIKQGNYKRCTKNYIDEQIEALNESNNLNLSAIYLLDKTQEECDLIERKYGVVAICAESISQKHYLFNGDAFSLDKKRSYGLRYMEFKDKLRKPCNALIIIDPYLLCKYKKDDEGVLRFPNISNNLESLLDAILPEQELESDFHLTIVSSLDSKELKDKVNLKKPYEQIKKCLKRINRKKIKIGFFYIDRGFNRNVESFHSRHILANNFIIDSEDGFDLFDDSGRITKNNPTLSIVFPFLVGDSRHDITKYVNWLRSVKKHVSESSDDFYFGSKENRLFDLV